MKLSDYLLVSDVDGTLLDHNGVPSRNREAVQRFIDKGGRFGIATGRSQPWMLYGIEGLPLNAPCVVFNGGGLYDPATDTMLMEQFLPEQTEEYLLQLWELNPQAGLLAVNREAYCRVGNEESYKRHWKIPGELLYTSLGEVPRPWYKALYQLQEQELSPFIEACWEQDLPGVQIVASSKWEAEVLPAGISKASALALLVKQGMVERGNLVAIGDYYNDVQMIEYAGLGVTLCTAPEDIKAKADLIVGDCGGGAVADLIEYLEGLCE